MAAPFKLSAELTVQLNNQSIRQTTQAIKQGLSQGAQADVRITIPQATKAQLGQTSSLLDQIRAKAEAAKVGVGSFAAQAGAAGAAVGLLGGAIGSVVGQLRSGIGDAVRFNTEMTRLRQVAEEPVGQLRAIGQAVRDLATTYGVSSRELIKGAVTLKQAGLAARDVKAAMDALAKASLAPNFSGVEQTVEGLIAVSRQFGIEGKDFERTLGSINAVAGGFAVEAGDIITAVQKAGGAFKAAGGDLNEFLALFTSIRATTRESAETIGDGLKSILARVQRPETIDQLRALGANLRFTRQEAEALGQTELADQFVGPFEAVKRLSEGVSRLKPSDPRFASVVESVGSIHQVSRVIPLIQQFTEAQKALNVARAGGVSLDIAAEQRQAAIETRLTRVTEKMQALVSTLVESKSFSAVVSVLDSVASGLDRVVRAAEPLLPVVAAIGGAKLLQTAAPFVENKLRGPRRFATGGVVQGTGEGDTVPALLTPGEFVVRRAVAQSIGYGPLFRLNRGGLIPPVPKDLRVSPKDLLAQVGAIVEDNADRYGADPTELYARHRDVVASALTPAVLARIPKGSQIVGVGSVGVAIRTPDGNVLRLQSARATRAEMDRRPGIADVLSPDRPNIRAVLQPLASQAIGRGDRQVFAELLPYAESALDLPPAVRRQAIQQLGELARQDGYKFEDAHAGNIGKVGDRFYVIDPGAVQPLARPIAADPKATTGPYRPRRYAGGGEVVAQLMKQSARNFLTVDAEFRRSGLPPLDLRTMAGGLLFVRGGAFRPDAVGSYDWSARAVHVRARQSLDTVGHELLGHAASREYASLLGSPYRYASSHRGTPHFDVALASLKDVVQDPRIVDPSVLQYYLTAHGDDPSMLLEEGLAFAVESYLVNERAKKGLAPLSPALGEAFRSKGVRDIFGEIRGRLIPELKVLSEQGRPVVTRPIEWELMAEMFGGRTVRQRKFAAGGLVPGVGDGDTVPAMLEPGSFVVRKRSVERAGPEALAALAGKRFAGGGQVPAMVTPGEYVYTPDETTRIGLPALRALNATGRVPRFALGGHVPDDDITVTEENGLLIGRRPDGTIEFITTAPRKPTPSTHPRSRPSRRSIPPTVITAPDGSQVLMAGGAVRPVPPQPPAPPPPPAPPASPPPPGGPPPIGASSPEVVKAADEAFIQSVLEKRGLSTVAADTFALGRADLAVAQRGGPALLSNQTQAEVAAVELARAQKELAEGVERQLRALTPAISATEARRKAEELAAQAILEGAAVVRDESGRAVGLESLAGQLAAQGGPVTGVSKGQGVLNRAKLAIKSPLASIRAGVGALGRTFGQGGVGSLTLLGVAPLLGNAVGPDAGEADRLAASGGDTSSFRRQSQAAGALQGAALGAAAGSLFGPWGTAIGATVGALHGLADSAREATRALREAKVNADLGALAPRLDSLSKGGSALDVRESNRLVAEVRAAIAEQASDSSRTTMLGLEAGFDASRYGSELRSQTRQTFGPQLITITQALNKAAEDAGRQSPSADPAQLAASFSQSNAELIRVLSSITNKTKKETGTDFEKVIADAQRAARLHLNSNRVADLSGRTATSFGRLVTAVDAAAQGLGSLEQRAVVLGAAFEGGAGQAGVFRPADPASSAAFASIAGEFGAQGGLVLESLKAGEALARVLPAVLSQVAAKNPTDGLSFSEQVRDGIRDALGGKLSGELARGLEQVVNQLSRRDVTDVHRAVGADVSKLSEDLVGGFAGPGKDTASALGVAVREQLGRSIEGLNQFAARAEAVGQGRDAVAGLELAQARFRADILERSTGVPALARLSRDQLAEPFDARQRRLAGDDGLNPRALAARLAKVQEEISRTTSSRDASLGRGSFEVASKLAGLTSEAGRLQKALANLTDAGLRTAAAQEKLAGLRATRDSRAAYLERYLTGDPDTRSEMRRGAGLVRTVLGDRDAFLRFTPSQQRLVLESLSGLGQARLAGGTRADLVKRELLERAAGGLLTPEEAREEVELEREVAKALADAAEAQMLLVERQEGLQSQFFDNLGSLHAQFFDRLAAELGRGALADLQVKTGDAGRRLGELRGLQPGAALLAQSGITTDDQLERLRARRSEVAAYGAAQANLARLTTTRQEVLERLFRPGGYDAFALTEDETDFSFWSDNRKGPSSDEFGGTGLRRPTIEKAAAFLNTSFADVLTGEQIGRVLGRFQKEGYDSARASYTAAREEGVDPNEAVRKALQQALTAALTAELGTEAQKVIDERRGLREKLAPVGLNEEGFERALGVTGGAAFLKALERFDNRDNPLSTFDERLRSTTAEFNLLEDQIKRINASSVRDARNRQGDAAGALGGGAVLGFAAGGPVFRPRGTDTVPAVLTPGEFVVSRDAARANMSLLKAINAGRSAAYMAEGGAVGRTPPDVDVSDMSDEELEKLNRFRNLRGLPPLARKTPSAQGVGGVVGGVGAGTFRPGPGISGALLGGAGAVAPQARTAGLFRELLQMGRIKRGLADIDPMAALEYRDFSPVEAVRFRERTRLSNLLAQQRAARSAYLPGEDSQANAATTVLQKAQARFEKLHREKYASSTLLVRATLAQSPELTLATDEQGRGVLYNPLIAARRNAALQARVQAAFRKMFPPFRAKRYLPGYQGYYGGTRGPTPAGEPTSGGRRGLGPYAPGVSPTVNGSQFVGPLLPEDPYAVSPSARAVAAGRFPAGDPYAVNPTYRGFAARRFQAGGLVGGFGSGDRVPALLEPGEFVLSRQAVQKNGVSNLNEANGRGGESGLNTDKLAQALTEFGAKSDGLGAALRAFGPSADRLTTALERFPTDVSHQHRIEAVLTVAGAEAFATMEDKFRDLMVGYVDKVVLAEFDRRLPDAPRPLKGAAR